MNIEMWASVILCIGGIVFFAKAVFNENGVQDLDEYDDWGDDFWDKNSENKRAEDTDDSDMGGINSEKQ